MNEPIETAATLVWMEEGVLHIQSKGIPSTRESVLETLEVVKDLIAGSPKPVIFDARQWPRGDPAAWATVIEGMQKSFTAAAVLIDPNSPAEFGEYPTVIDRLLIPFRLFTEEREAHAFVAAV